jgi:hypothetical protein
VADTPIAPFEPETPEWWACRLLRQVEARAPGLKVWDDYYEGKQPLAFASDKFRQAFGERFPAFTSNFCSLVVEATAERIEVQGFRFGSEEANAQAWAMWQENEMDASSQLAHTEALIKGMAYALVEPRGEAMPVITIEDALDCIVECDPRNRRVRRAGLKRWVDDEHRLVVVLYLPNGVFKYRTKAKWDDTYTRWWWQPDTKEDARAGERLWVSAGFERYQPPGDDAWPLTNPLGVVPLVELPNRPRLKTGGQSEIKAIRSNQDAVNKYRCDALVASEFAAFPQRYLLNFEVETDEETGKPKTPFQAAIDRLWVVPPPDPELENPPKAEFGQFDAASLEPYERMISLEVGHMSSISRLPYHALLGTPQTIPPSGESLKSSEAGLTKKVARTELFLGEAWEEVERLCFRARNSALANARAAETVWVDSETRNEATRTDAIVKLHAEGIIDDELAWELGGLTPEQMAGLKTRREEAAKAEAANPTPEPAPTGQPGSTDLVPAPTGPRMG